MARGVGTVSIVNRLMAHIDEINRTIVAVGEIRLADKFKAQRLYELDQEKTHKEAELILALLKENSLE